jgi:hypothetical protein
MARPLRRPLQLTINVSHDKARLIQQAAERDRRPLAEVVRLAAIDHLTQGEAPP